MLQSDVALFFLCLFFVILTDRVKKSPLIIHFYMYIFKYDSILKHFQLYLCFHSCVLCVILHIVYPCTLQISNGQTVQNVQIYVQEGAENGAVAEEKSTSEVSDDPKDVQYARIDFSIIKIRGAREVAKEQESTFTEYAEIKTEAKDQRKQSCKEASAILEGSEEDFMSKHDEELMECVSEEQGEEEAIYSSVTDV